jgi:hypothetical protein
MDSWAYAYNGLAGVWASSVLVGAPDSLAWLVRGVRPLSPGVANAILAMVPDGHSASVFRYHYSDSFYACAYAYAYAYAYAGAYCYRDAYSYSGSQVALGYCLGTDVGFG